jgi:hypothetical protein
MWAFLAQLFKAGMIGDEQMNDPGYCRQRAADFREKAHMADDPFIKSSLEAVAKEFEHRASELQRDAYAVTQAAFPKPGSKIG